MKAMKSLVAVLFAFSMISAGTAAAAVSGEAVYQQRCAQCHDSGNARIPPRAELNKLPITRILRAMDFGVMNNVATRLRQDEREAVAAYLGVAGDNGLPSAAAYCADRKVDLT